MHVCFSLNVGWVSFLNESSVSFHVFHIVPPDHRNANGGGTAKTRQESQSLIQICPCIRYLRTADTLEHFLIWRANRNVQLRRFLAQVCELRGHRAV